MYSSKIFSLCRRIYSPSTRFSSTHPFPNEDLLYTIKSPNDHIRSALYPLNSSDYPKQVLPDLHFVKMFRDIELLKENCIQRDLMVDINQLASDYDRWQREKKEFKRLRDLHHIQGKLREQEQTNDLSMTDVNEIEIETTIKINTKKRNKILRSATNPSARNESTTTTTTTTNQNEIQHAADMITSVDDAWIDAVIHASKTNDDSLYASGEEIMNDDEFNALKEHYARVREEFRTFDQRFIVACLRLPAARHIAVPAKPSPGVTLFESSVPIVKHAFNSKTWNELCHVEKSDVSVFGPYWLGAAPLRKHEIVRMICNDLAKLGFDEMASISMTKPFISEALGANINDSRRVLTTFEGADDPRSRSLITSGMGSLTSLLVPFARRCFWQSDLPYFVYTQGSTYHVADEQSYKIQLLAMTNIRDIHLKNFDDPLVEEPVNDLQAAISADNNAGNVSIIREQEYNIQIQSALRNPEPYRFKQTSSLDGLFLELTRLVYRLYDSFKLPFRIRNCPAHELRAYESMRLDYELFLPSANGYVRVGSVSLIGDYLSRRLMIRHKKLREEKGLAFKRDPSQIKSREQSSELPLNTKLNYVQMVHAQIVDVDMLVKCFVEKEQRGFSKTPRLMHFNNKDEN